MKLNKPMRESDRNQIQIEIESRESIEKRAYEPFAEHTALISITDKDYEFVALKNNPAYLLQMRFDDVSDEFFEKALGRQPTKAESALLADKFHMIDDGQAKEIAAFIKSIKGSAETLICQCEYGESRSAGIAAAVRQFLYTDGIVIFSDERYYPNKLVYEKVLAALEAERDS